MFLKGTYYLLDEFVVKVGVKLDLILVTVSYNVFGSNKLCYSHELILIISPFKERFSVEHHSSQHATHTPNVKLIIVISVSNQKFRSLKVTRCHSAIVVLVRYVEVSKAPVRNFYSLSLVVKEDIARLNVSMNQAF